MTAIASARPSIYLSAPDVLSGPLPLEISMAPIVSGVPFAHERIILDGPEGFFAVWACDAGIYPRVKDRRGSFMYILSGDASIVDQDGTEHVLTADSVILLPFGWVGTWHIRETIRKVYLHTDPTRPYRDGVQPSVFSTAAEVLADRLPDGGAVVFDGPDGRCTIWEGQPGAQPDLAKGKASFFYVISGSGGVRDEDGPMKELTAGASVALPPEWTGEWTIAETMRLMIVQSTPLAQSGEPDAE